MGAGLRPSARRGSGTTQGWSLGVSVNIAARTLLEADLLDRLARMLASAGVDAQWLTLELTESSIMADPVRSGKVLAALGDFGVRLAIDDFGTGYSSLTRLKQLPIHVVKIDKSFVMSMSVDEGDQAIVRSTIDLARNLGHTVVAEGVEDQVTWDQLAALGCDWAQGFYLARPMTAASSTCGSASAAGGTCRWFGRPTPRSAPDGGPDGGADDRSRRVPFPSRRGFKRASDSRTARSAPGGDVRWPG